MLKAASYGAAVLLASFVAFIALSVDAVVLRWPLASLAAQHGGSVLAAYVAARRAPRWSGLLALLMAAIAAALWTAHGVGDVIHGVVFYPTTDLVAGTAEAMIRRLGRAPTADLMIRAAAGYSLVVNLVLCAAGVTWGRARARQAGGAEGTPGAALSRPDRERARLWVTTLAAVVVSAFSARALLVQARPPKANSWILPDGCVGWVQVDFNIPNAPPLPQEDGYGVIRVPVSGHVQTSSAFVEDGRVQAWYERDGKRIAVPEHWAYWSCPSSLGRKLAASEPVSVFAFFGPEADYERMHSTGRRETPDRHSHPSPGLIRCGER